MTKFVNKFKKPFPLDHFFPIFSIFWAKKVFRDLAVTNNFIWISSTMPKFRKN